MVAAVSNANTAFLMSEALSHFSELQPAAPFSRNRNREISQSFPYNSRTWRRFNTHITPIRANISAPGSGCACKLAKSTRHPEWAARLVERAADLKDEAGELPPPGDGLKAPDVLGIG
jgi:hypothetical protein